MLSETEEHHRNILEKVLDTLKCAGIKVNYDKCQFYTEKIEYLGHIFNSQGVHTDKNKIRAILDAPSPKNIKELQSFIVQGF